MLGFECSEEFVSDNLIVGAETLFGVKFPETYCTMIREYSGAFGDVEFRVDRASPGFDYCSVGLVLSLNPCNRNSIYSVMASWPEHELSDRIIPLGEDGGGNYVCFDYRQSKVPQIAFYFHELSGEDGIIKVCGTFDGFLERLELPKNKL